MTSACRIRTSMRVPVVLTGMARSKMWVSQGCRRVVRVFKCWLRVLAQGILVCYHYCAPSHYIIVSRLCCERLCFAGDVSKTSANGERERERARERERERERERKGERERERERERRERERKRERESERERERV